MKLTEQTRAFIDTVFTWAAALTAVGLLIGGTVAVIVNGVSGQTITEFAIPVVLIIWLTWLTVTVAGQHERIDDAVDTAYRTLGAAEHDAAVAHGRHAARPTPRPRQKETAK